MHTEKGLACCVRGYHVYKAIWAAAVGEVLVCTREATNSADRYVCRSGTRGGNDYRILTAEATNGQSFNRRLIGRVRIKLLISCSHFQASNLYYSSTVLYNISLENILCKILFAQYFC